MILFYFIFLYLDRLKNNWPKSSPYMHEVFLFAWRIIKELHMSDFNIDAIAQIWPNPCVFIFHEEYSLTSIWKLIINKSITKVSFIFTNEQKKSYTVKNWTQVNICLTDWSLNQLPNGIFLNYFSLACLVSFTQIIYLFAFFFKDEKSLSYV